MADSILLIDDDASVLRAIGAFFEQRGWDVFRELSGEAGLAMWERTHAEVVLLDLNLPGIDGLEVLERLRGRETAVILLTGDGDVRAAVQAMRSGAENFLVKPVDLEHLMEAAKRAAEKVRLRRLNRALVGQTGPHDVVEALGSREPMRSLRAQVTTLARSDQAGILLEGESGTGKRTVARILHDLSVRRDAPFVEVSCMVPDATALQAQLFGTEAGANGSPPLQQGLIELADGGTLLLTEIVAAPASIQHALAQVLTSRAFRRVGGVREIPVDVRLVGTTSESTADTLTSGRFTKELYYQLRVTPIAMPPLKERHREDLLAVIRRKVEGLVTGLPGAPSKLSDEVLERLLAYQWPGNLREMANVLERALLASRGREQVEVEHLPAEFRARPGPFDRRHTPLTIDEVERMHIDRTLKHHKGNRTRAAEELGISRATLIAKIKRYAIPH
jgi:DNA-binding NtrC family response regulator